MRVRHLQTYIQSQRLVGSNKVAVLRGMTVGLDTTAWIRSLLELKDAYSDIMGGLPLGLRAVLDQQLQGFEEAEIFPAFFLQGLTPYGHSLFSKVDPKVISEAWRLVVRRETDVALSKFARILSRITDELMIELSRYLRAQQYIDTRTEKVTGRAVHLKRRRLAVFGCPYLCSGQMLYFLECQLLDAVFGVAAHTLMGFSRVVTNIDFVSRKFEWVNKAQLLQAWHISDQQLADACILAGNEYCHTLPHVNAIAPQFTFDVAIQLARGGPLSMYLQFFPDPKIQNEFRHLYATSRALMSCVVAMQGNGKVSAFHPSSIQYEAQNPSDSSHQKMPSYSAMLPGDYYKVGGWRLPENVFMLMMDGLLSPTLPRVLSYGEWRDTESPILLSVEFENLLVQLRDHRLLALGLIARHLHPSFHNRRITFEYLSRHCQDPMILLTSVTSGVTEAQYKPNTAPLLQWCFSVYEVSDRLARDKLNAPTLSWCIDWHLSSMHAHYNKDLSEVNVAVDPARRCSPITTGMDPVQIAEVSSDDLLTIESKEGVHPIKAYALALVNFTFLDCLGYFDHSPNSMGGPTAMSLLLREKGKPQFAQETILALELLKFGLLSGADLHYSAENDYPQELTNPPVEPLHALSKRVVAKLKQLRMSHIPAAASEPAVLKRSLQLVSRSVSIVAVQLAGHLTQCPAHFVNFDIGSFQSLVRSTRRELNHIMEGCIAGLILEHPRYHRVFTPDLFDPRDPIVPWFSPVVGVAGVIMRAVLTAEVRTAEDAQVAYHLLARTYPEVPNFWSEILRLCEFWAQLSSIVRSLTQTAHASIAVQFANADILVCLQLWDFLKLANGSGNLQQQCPRFCDLIEKTLGVEICQGSTSTSRSQAPSLATWKAIGVVD